MFPLIKKERRKTEEKEEKGFHGIRVAEDEEIYVIE
jgi:uncharacterized protein YpiB (UPF0302 family)